MALTKEKAAKHQETLDQVSALFLGAYMLYSIGTAIMEDGEELLNRNGLELEHGMKHSYKAVQHNMDRLIDYFRVIMGLDDQKRFVADYDKVQAQISELALGLYKKK